MLRHEQKKIAPDYFSQNTQMVKWSSSGDSYVNAIKWRYICQPVFVNIKITEVTAEI